MSFFGLFKTNNKKTAASKNKAHIVDISDVKKIIEKFLTSDESLMKKYDIRVKEEYNNQVPLTNIKKSYKSPVIYVQDRLSKKMFILSFFGKYINVTYVENNKIVPSDENEIKDYFKYVFDMNFTNLKNHEGKSDSYVYDNKLLLLEPISLQLKANDYTLYFAVDDAFDLSITIKNTNNHIIDNIKYSLIQK